MLNIGVSELENRVASLETHNNSFIKQIQCTYQNVLDGRYSYDADFVAEVFYFELTLSTASNNTIHITMMGSFMKKSLPLLGIVILVAIMTLTRAQRTKKETRDEEPNPLIEAAKALLQDQLQNQGGGGAAQAVTGLLQNFLQSDGGQHIGDILMGATKSNNGVNAVDILSGLGSILSSATAEQRKSNEGGFDPQLIGQMISMFANQAMNANNGDGDSNNNVDINNNEIKSGKNRKKVGGNDAGIDWESMLNLASNFMAAQGANQPGWEGVLNILPMLLGGDSSNGVKKVHNKHQQHTGTSYLPPFMETLYDYWEHFKSSELGQTLWHNSGLEATVQLFTDKDGHFEMERIFGSLENATFRRRWIKSLTSFVAEWIAHISDPATQTRYLATMQFVGNGFLKAQGYHKGQLFDPARPAESLSHLVNAVFKRQFGLKVNSATYIRPAVTYIQEVLRMGHSKGLSLSHLSSHEIESKLAETLNGEVIEPMLRVWRAYQYGIRHPQCDCYVICAVNQHDPSANQGAGLRPGITKLGSITASWFLSSNTGTQFWKLYSAATEDQNCQIQYPVDCSDYHAEDIKATTEYAHSEL